MREIKSHSFENIGLDYVQYFPGRSAHGTAFEEVFVGQGDSAQEAFDDALDMMAEDEWDVSSLDKTHQDELDHSEPLTYNQQQDDEAMYYVAIYVR